ncbi:MAG: hypothetical protein ACLVH3_03145 [Blautia obeum]
MKIKRNYLIKIAPAVLLVVGAYWLLGSDFFTFLIWWEMICLLGLVFMPVTSRIFRGFDDNGWMFSKVLAVAVCGYVQWLLACLKITPFTGMTCVIITVICCLGSILYGIKCKNRITNSLPLGTDNPGLPGRNSVFFWCFFSGHIWRDFIRRLMERKNIWILVLCSP